MKVKINKLQNGGGFATFTPIISNYPGNSITESQSSASEKGSSSILDEKMIEHLYKQGGLVNDVNRLVIELNQLEKTSNMPFLSSQNRSATLQVIAKINEVNQNKKYWEDAISRAKESGGLGEVAVDGERIFVKTKDNKIQTMNLTDYVAKQSKVKALSVQELMYERQYNPSLTGQNGVFTVADNAIGMNKITDHIKEIIFAFGEESKSETKYYTKSDIQQKLNSFTGKKPTQEEIVAIQKLQEIASSPGDLYKIKAESSSERTQAMRAVDYIWRTLGSNAQQKLNATAVITGVNNPKSFILDMILNQTNNKTVYEISPEKLPGSTDTDKEIRNEKSLTQFQLLHKDKLATKDAVFSFNDPKLGILFRGAIGGVSPVITKDGDSVGMTTIDRILFEGGYNQILETNNVFYGDKKVDASNFGNIIYDGKDGAKVYMPVDDTGGPDYGSFGRFKQVYAVYEQNKDKWDAKTAMDYFKKFNYNLQIEEKNENNERALVIKDNAKIKPFWIMYGYTNDATDLVKGNSLLTELSSDEENIWKPKLEQIWTIWRGTKQDKSRIPNTFGPEDYYKGMIAIPYRTGYAANVDAMVNQGPKDRIQSIGTIQANLRNNSTPVFGSTNSMQLNTQ